MTRSGLGSEAQHSLATTNLSTLPEVTPKIALLKKTDSSQMPNSQQALFPFPTPQLSVSAKAEMDTDTFGNTWLLAHLPCCWEWHTQG